MSRVTNLIIALSSGENIDSVIEQFGKFILNGQKFRIASVEGDSMPPKWYGGSKRLECGLLIGAYNYLDLELLINFMKTEIQWENADMVQLIVKEQDEFVFKILSLIPNE